jgi:hypothetical protein
MQPIHSNVFVSTIAILLVQGYGAGSISADTEADIALKGGLNSSIFAHENRESISGFSGGLEAHLEKPFVDHVSLGGQIELIYSQRGAEVVVGGQHLARSREHYMDLTAAVRPQLQFGPIHLYVVLGGGLDFLVHATTVDLSRVEQDVTDELHRFDIELLGAAGVAVALPRHTLGPLRLDTIFAEAREDVGLLKVDDDTGSKNRTTSVMLGLSFAVAASSPR